MEIPKSTLCPFSLRKVPILNLVVYARFSFPDKKKKKNPPFHSVPPGTSQHSPPPPHPFWTFFFLGGTLRKNVIQHIQPAQPPNLRCKHVPTDSLKELIALNNLTIWLWRSIPTRLLALPRLGPIQSPAMLLWCREREREREIERERERERERGGEACQEAEKRREWQRPPSAPCLSCWRPRTPAETLNPYDPTADHWLECYWERWWEEGGWQ